MRNPRAERAKPRCLLQESSGFAGADDPPDAKPPRLMRNLACGRRFSIKAASME
jgi:hypothetical protein